LDASRQLSKLSKTLSPSLYIKDGNIKIYNSYMYFNN
jgi:hypothetical protein